MSTKSTYIESVPVGGMTMGSAAMGVVCSARRVFLPILAAFVLLLGALLLRPRAAQPFLTYA